MTDWHSAPPPEPVLSFLERDPTKPVAPLSAMHRIPLGVMTLVGGALMFFLWASGFDNGFDEGAYIWMLLVTSIAACTTWLGRPPKGYAAFCVLAFFGLVIWASSQPVLNYQAYGLGTEAGCMAPPSSRSALRANGTLFDTPNGEYAVEHFRLIVGSFLLTPIWLTGVLTFLWARKPVLEQRKKDAPKTF